MDGQLAAARTAQNGHRIEFFFRPDDRGVSGKRGVALMTWEPIPATLELDRDDVAFTVIMRAPRLFIDVDADNIHAVNIRVHSNPFARAEKHENGRDRPAGDHENKSAVERTGALAQFADNFRSEETADACDAIDEADGRSRR